MDNNIRKKNIILSVVVVLVGIMLVGGTYAYLSLAVNVTNKVVNGSTTCFNIDYLDTNQITGTLFPSANHTKGISGKVSLKVNSACDLDGVGNIYIHANSGTSTKFTTTAAAHCENPNTLQTLTQYTTSSTCTSNSGIWVTTGTPLKYAVFNNSTGIGNPLDVGYINAIGSDIAVYKTFIVTKTQKDYYIFLWLDGYLTDNTYTNLPFNGYVKADAIQARTVYTANVSPSTINIGQSIPNGITEYHTPEAAMAALKTNLGSATDLPFFLNHIVGNNVVAASYVGFVVTPAMATANPGMVAGTYYLRGGDGGAAFLDNAKTIYDAFGGVGCNLDGSSGGNPYTTTPSSTFYCYVSDLGAYAFSDDSADAYGDADSHCSVGGGGGSRCAEQ